MTCDSFLSQVYGQINKFMTFQMDVANNSEFGADGNLMEMRNLIFLRLTRLSSTGIVFAYFVFAYRQNSDSIVMTSRFIAILKWF